MNYGTGVETCQSETLLKADFRQRLWAFGTTRLLTLIFIVSPLVFSATSALAESNVISAEKGLRKRLRQDLRDPSLDTALSEYLNNFTEISKNVAVPCLPVEKFGSGRNGYVQVKHFLRTNTKKFISIESDLEVFGCYDPYIAERRLVFNYDIASSAEVYLPRWIIASSSNVQAAEVKSRVAAFNVTLANLYKKGVSKNRETFALCKELYDPNEPIQDHWKYPIISVGRDRIWLSYDVAHVVRGCFSRISIPANELGSIIGKQARENLGWSNQQNSGDKK